MKLQSITIAAAIVVAGVRAGAQDVRVEVFEAATGKPIVGANVSLYDSAGTIPFGGGFSDQGGRAELRAPSRGCRQRSCLTSRATSAPSNARRFRSLRRA